MLRVAIPSLPPLGHIAEWAVICFVILICHRDMTMFDTKPNVSQGGCTIEIRFSLCLYLTTLIMSIWQALHEMITLIEATQAIFDPHIPNCPSRPVCNSEGVYQYAHPNVMLPSALSLQKWVAHFFQGEMEAYDKQVKIVQFPFYSVTARANCIIYITFTYDHTVSFNRESHNWT